MMSRAAGFRRLLTFRTLLLVALALAVSLLLALLHAPEARAQSGGLSLTVTERTESSLTVQWSQLADVTTYTIILLGGDEFQVHTASPGEDTHVFTGLQADFEYELSVSAFRSDATSAGEVQIRARTLPAIEPEPTPVVEPEIVPEVSVTAGPEVSEGSDAVFTITADPAPTSDITVELTITAGGDVIGEGETGGQTLTVPASGSATYAVSTVDDGVVESPGTITATLVSASGGYAVADAPSDAATVPVTSEDRLTRTPTINLAQPTHGTTEYIPTVFILHVLPAPDKPLLINVKLSQENDFYDPSDLGLKHLLIPAKHHSLVHRITPIDDSVAEPDGKLTLDLLPGAGYKPGPYKTVTEVIYDRDLTEEERKNYTPEIQVVGTVVNGGPYEGSDYRFRFTSKKSLASPLPITVEISQIGDFVAPERLGKRQLTIPPAPSHSYLIVPTVDDGVDEPHGRVVARVLPGDGYVAAGWYGGEEHSGSDHGSQWIQDNDDVEFTLATGPDIIEGGEAEFTISASAASPARTETIKALVSQGGDFVGAPSDLGLRTLTITTGQSVTLRVATDDDSADEADGWVSLSIEGATAQVVVSDDDGGQVAQVGDCAADVSTTCTARVDGKVGGVLDSGLDEDWHGVSLTAGRTYWMKAWGFEAGVFCIHDAWGDCTQERRGYLDDGFVFTPEKSGTWFIGVRPSGVIGQWPPTPNQTVPPGLLEVELQSLAEIAEYEKAYVLEVATVADDYPADATTTGQLSADGSAATGRNETRVDVDWFRVSLSAGVRYLIYADSTLTKSGLAHPLHARVEGVYDADGNRVASGVESPLAATAPDAVVTPDADGTYYVAVTGNLYNYRLARHPAADTGERPFIDTPYSPGSSFTASIEYATCLLTALDCYNSFWGLSLGNGVESSDWHDGGVPYQLSVVTGEDDDGPKPVVSVADGSGITEGDSVTFTVTASPAPAADLAVSITAATTGDFGYGPLPGSVTIPTGGSATVTITTTDDEADEADGSVTLTLNAGSDYTVGALSSETVSVTDDDEALGEQTQGYEVPAQLIADVRGYAAETEQGADHVNRWNRVLVAFGEHDGTGVTGGPMTAAEAQTYADNGWSRWVPVVTELTNLEAANNDDPKPEISVSGGSGVTEGGNASFTVSASPAPSSNLDVSVTVSQSGDYGAATGQRTVTVPTTGSVTFTVGTTDDSADETDGSVTATLDTPAADAGYTVSATQGAATVAVSDDDDSKPEVSISAGSGITEGGSASFTVSASPAPASNLDVSVTVSASGDYGATTGQRTVTIPTTGSVTFTVGTTDDSADETDGSVTATLDTPAADAGYTVDATQGAATVSVSDDDTVGYTVDATVLANVKSYAAETHEGAEHVNRWKRVLVAFGEHDGTGVTGGPMTAAEAQTYADRGWSRWDPVVTELTNLEAANNNDPKPEISVSGGSGITEGGNASFTVSASPAPASNLDVSVTVSASGDYGATTGQRTVTIPTTGSVTFTVGTTDDSADEADGSVTATVNAGSAYTVSSTQGAATVSVSDNDDATKPVVSVSGGSGITEGGNASFTVSASPAPASNLDVSVTVSQSGDYGATTGQRTVTIPTTGSVTFTVGTTDDSTDEADGSVTATLNAGSAYTVSSTQGAATVSVSDNDDAPKPVVSVSGGSGITEGGSASFTVSASPAPASNMDVSVTVSQSGDYGATTGQRTVTIPTTGSVTFSVGTTDDSTDETDGSVTATVNAGSAYTVSATQGAATVSVSDNDDAPKPVVSVSGGSGITEGGSASFTVSASPAPSSNLDVSVTVSQSGDYGATTGQRTVTIPTTGSVTFTVGTTDDSTDETDGSVTATVNAGSAYTVSSTQGAATVSVSDNDDPVVEEQTGYTVDPDVIAKVRELASQTQHGTAHVNRWNRVLLAFGEHDGAGVTGGPMTAAEAQEMADRHSSPVWDEVVTELTALAAASTQTPPPPPTPEVSVSAGSGITEGGDAVFTVTASPAPASNLDVSVTVSQSGDYGATTGQRTVTIPTTGSVTLTVGTTDDTTDETDGSVTATVNAGSGYTVSSSQGAATVGVADNDAAPTPVVSVTGGNGVTEGGDAVFTVTASPAPASNLDVSVTVSQSGDYGAATGKRTVTVPTTGSVTLTVGTTDDSADETDGSVTATVNAGSGYTVSSSQGAATVAVSDNDDAPTPVVSISGGNGVTEGGSAVFTVTASPAPASNLDVSVTISQSGDYGATTGQRTVTIPTSGSVTLTVGTTDDTTDEADGSVTATVNAGAGYTVSSSQGAATVAVSDNDDAPTPVVSVTGGNGITEGGSAVFTVTASPAPASNLDVSVTVSQGGDYGATTGQKTVTIPTSGSVTLTVATTDDTTDEADGSVTATVNAGSGYTVSSTQGAATVAVSDNDDAPTPVVEETDEAVLADCGDSRPTVLINNPTASRSDATVEFEVSLDCKPSGSVTLLLSVLRNGEISSDPVTYAALDGEETSITVTVEIRDSQALGLTLAWSSGVANRTETTGNVEFTD